MNKPAIKLKQPPVFKLVALTTICERIGFYVISYLMVMFMKHQFNLTDTSAFSAFGVFTALSFLTPAIGGYLGDNVIGIRRSILLGLFFEGTGLLLMIIPGYLPFVFALSFMVIGSGFFKTSPSDLLAHSYRNDNDPRIDSGFTYYYMAINLGTLIAGIVASFIQRYFGWNWSFLTGGLLMYMGILFYFIFHHTADHIDTKAGSKKMPSRTITVLILGLALFSAIFMFLLIHVEFSNNFFIFATICTALYLFYEMTKSDKTERWHILACLYLIFLGFVCAVLYFQMYTSLELFIQRAVVRTFFGYKIPTIMFLSMESAFVIMLGPVLSALYDYLAKRKSDLHVMTKLTIGLLATSVSFFALVIGSHYHNNLFQISAIWIVIMFLIFTVGDLMNSALGVAMVTHIAPKRMYGFMMGAWYLVGNALAASVSGKFASIANIPTFDISRGDIILQIYTHAFYRIGLLGVCVSVLAFAINPFIKKLIHSK